MIDLLQLVIVGSIVGSIVGLGAIGLTLSYGVTRFANFAHGDLMTAGMFIAYAWVGTLGWAGPRVGPFSFGWGMVPAVALAVGGVAAIALVGDGLIYRRLRQRGSGVITMAVASLGMAIMLRAVVQLLWGPSPVRYTQGVNLAVTLPGGLKAKPDQFLIVGVTALSAVALYLLLYRTRLGKAMRATADNPQLAEISGIATGRVHQATWAIAGGLAALAGVMLAVQSQLRFDSGFSLLLPMFAAAILGGIGSPWGALLGGLAVGITAEVSTMWIDPGFKSGVPFVILIAMLLIRPRGLFGSRLWSR